MVKEIYVYVEGGGKGSGRKEIRRGMGIFLKELVDIARDKRIGWHIVACGSRNSTYDAFRIALQSHPDAFNVLLASSF